MSPPLALHRLGNALHRCGVPLLPRLVTGIIRVCFACYLPSSAKLGRGVQLGYWGLGVVIHGAAEVGEGTLIRQNVTLGTRHKGGGVPKVGARVSIGAGAVLLGDITVGDGAIIGANSVVTRDVPPGITVVGAPARPLSH